MDSRRGAPKKADRPTIQFNPDTTGLDSRGRKLKWSGDLSKVQVNLNKIFIKNAVSFAPTLNIGHPSSPSQDSTSRGDQTDEPVEDSLARLRISAECPLHQQNPGRSNIVCPNCQPEPAASLQGQDADKVETESEQSTLIPPTSKSERRGNRKDFDEDDFDRKIMFV
nr:expressed protein [Hymenolepis microstoma]